jgi:thiol-disulfide isomerase/thioredoxin
MTCMYKCIAIILIFILAASNAAVPLGPVPRKAPELSFFDPSGKAVALSHFKGKVVAVEFFFIGSMHCVRVAQVLNKLNEELGSRGFQPLAVAFTVPQVPQSVADATTVDNFVHSYRLSFPAGYTDKENVDMFLSRSAEDMPNIPQVVIIDRAGIIRAQSGNRPGDPKLEDGDSLRVVLDGLLKESAPPDTAPAKPSSPSKKGQSKSSRATP